jgi:hypothetical protein
MSVLSPASKPAAPTPLGDTITAALIIVIPLALTCFAARLHIIELSHAVRAGSRCCLRSWRAECRSRSRSAFQY